MPWEAIARVIVIAICVLAVAGALAFIILGDLGDQR